MASPDKPPFKVKALYDYASGHDDDLNFETDEIITVTDIEGDEWYYGKLVDKATGETKEGLFPANFVEKVAVEIPARPQRRPPPKQPEEQPPQPKEEPKPEPEPKPEEPVISKSPEPIVKQAPKPVVEEAPKAAPPAPKAAPPPAQPAPEPSASQPKKEKPPPPDKPSSSSFKDRLALFNKGGAAPVAPFQPKPRADFIKKPFVAPPPSKNAYIPPPISNIPKPRRDEETDMLSPPLPEDIVRSSQEFEREPEENIPKQSLKERIALLQTQTLNPHVGGEKPKRPPKPKRATSDRSHEGSEVISPGADEADQQLGDDLGAPPAKPKRSLDIRREPEHDDSSSVGDVEPHSAVSEARIRHVHAPAAQASDFGDDEGGNDTPDQQDSSQDDAENEDEAEEEEEEIDPEVARKIALRERMMKMSGGMGMMGVFGAPMGMPPPAPPKKKVSKSKSGDSEGKPRKSHDESHEEEAPAMHAPPVPLPFVLPQKVQSPTQVEKEVEVEEKKTPNLTEEGKEDEEVDVEDLKPTHPQGPRPIPEAPKPDEERPPPPRPPTADRPPPPPPPAPPVEQARPPPPPPPVIPDASEGSESGDELSEVPSKMASPALHPTTAPLVIPPPPPVPGSRPGSSAGPLSPASPGERRGSQGYLAGQPTASSVGSPPTSPVPTNRRASYQPGKSAIPPVPGAFPAPPTPQARPPPPPPPTGAPPAQPPPTAQEDSTEEEVTEYEADYDTDMANKVGHRDALTAHSRSITEDDDTPLPSPPAAPHRSVPPPPPPVPGTSNSRPGSARQSLDMPRAAPPMPPPPPPAPVQEQSSDDDDEVGDEYDPYRYGSASHPPPATSAHPPPSSYDDPRPMTGSGRPKMSMDLPRPPPSRGTLDATSRAGRRSMDTARPFTDHIAHELDLTSLNPWWTLPTPLPPILGPRAKDLILEAEESTSTKRGGRVQVQKDIYILFHDYSQSIITARYDASNPTASSAVSFEQRHEPPPPQPRQDQLEDFSIRFGAAVHTFASSAAGKTIGDGDPHSLVSAAISSVPNVLSPVGHRAYGALVYANLANASVQQWDEIRRGDVVTFRNARFVGHKGGLHSKYTLEVREHVGVVEEWDGTKKKVKIWEQGRLEGDGGHGEKGAKKKGVREEAYRMGDLRSGEVKVWRVVGRAWVGWE